MDDYEIEKFAKALHGSFRQLANAITPLDALPGKDAAGGRVASLTESVCGITAGLVAVAESIDNLAKAVRSLR